MVICLVFAIFYFWLRKDLQKFTKILLKDEMDDAGNRRLECF